ncbi:MAG: hypothetical protein ACR2PA_06595, partial [Hyphomicrobiaceae bacterium]
RSHRVSAVLVFSVTRSLVTGLLGVVIAFVGQSLISLQTTAWMIFGFVYLGVVLVYLLGRLALLKWSIDLTPREWTLMKNPIALGLAFGLYIPACAAPLLLGLIFVLLGAWSIWFGLYVDPQNWSGQ